MNRKNIICADTLVGDEWEFAEGIRTASDEKWEIKSWNNAGLMKNRIDNFKRLIGYFVHAMWIFTHRNDINKIICWQQFYGIIFAFYCCVFHVKKKNQLMIMTFIYKEKNGTIGKLYSRFISFVVRSKYVDKIIVFSESEVGLYTRQFKVRDGKFQYLPLGIPREKIMEKTKQSLPIKFFLSVGRSNRDYEFLFDCVDEIQIPVVVLSDSVNCEVPRNVIMYDNIRGDEYKKILKECYAVLLPLKDPNISSGQLVLLQAMQNRKPVIVTEGQAIVNYVKNDVSAIICRKDKDSFVSATNKILNSKKLYATLVENGYKTYKDFFSEFALGQRVARIEF